MVPARPPPAGLGSLGPAGEVARRRRPPVLVSVAHPTGHRGAVHVASHARTQASVTVHATRHHRSRVQDTP